MGAWDFIPRDVAWVLRFFYGRIAGLARSGEFQQNTHRIDIGGDRNPKPVFHVLLDLGGLCTDFGCFRDETCDFGPHLVICKGLFRLRHLHATQFQKNNLTIAAVPPMRAAAASAGARNVFTLICLVSAKSLAISARILSSAKACSYRFMRVSIGLSPSRKM